MVKATELFKTWEAVIYLQDPNGTRQRIRTSVQAPSSAMAKKLLQKQYGKEAVQGTPKEIKL
jgi:hypothetical protein